MVTFCPFLFFKQKTAYEMRISDWSSDVCSSDLGVLKEYRQHRDQHRAHQRGHKVEAVDQYAPLEDAFQDECRLLDDADIEHFHKIGRASCRERVCQYV